MPVDISFVFKNERPAGKHGFAQAKGENIYFEDGTLAKFWGVMFNGAACFPTHQKAEQVAQRLAQAGINIVRFHQMDDEWTAPNLYRLTAGERVKNTRELCEACLERLDYLIKCLKDQGIYCTVDMTTYRRFKPGDGVKDAHLLHDGSRLYAMYDPTMIELQKEFMTKFWNHKNPYTKLKYKDDPVFVMCCIINENDTFIDHSKRRWYNLIPHYDQMFRDMFAEWMKARKVRGFRKHANECVLFDMKDELQVQFRMELMHKYCDDMYAYLRSLGVKIPISGSNYHTCVGVVKAQENMDFQDAHSYFYDWKWGETEKICAHAHITKAAEAPLAGPIGNRIHGKPFFMTEWDVPFPNSYRAEGTLWYSSMSCLQNWTGMTVHTYGYGHDMSKFDLLGKIASTDTIGGVPYREGIFAVWNDPAQFGLFPHAALMVRRGDIQPAKMVIGADVRDKAMYGGRASKLAGTAMEIHQVHSVLDTTNLEGIDELRDPKKAYEREEANFIVSDTGEIRRDLAKGIGYIDTPRTKSIYGNIGSGAVNTRNVNTLKSLTDVAIAAKTDFGSVTMSSLTDDPITDSDNILLTAVGRARNHGAQFDGDKMIDAGTNPIEIEVIKAHIEIKTSKKVLEVWAVDSDGFYSGRINSTIEDGVLKFDIGNEFSTMYYLIYEP